MVRSPVTAESWSRCVTRDTADIGIIATGVTDMAIMATGGIAADDTTIAGAIITPTGTTTGAAEAIIIIDATVIDGGS